jgi:ER membrane protein complex subunit 1
MSLSGPGGAVLRSFDYSTGQLILEKRLYPLHASHCVDLGDFGLGSTVATMKEYPDIFTLTCGNAVRRIAENGRIQWVWQSSDNT